MKSNTIYLTLLMACAAPVLGDVSYISAPEDFRIIESNLKAGCSIGETRISKTDKSIFISTEGDDIAIPIDSITTDNNLILGDMTGNGYCDLAAPYAKSDVNESYTLFVYDPQHKKLKKSNAGIITNPAFKENKIITSYRDAAQWHEDSFCYSENLNDFFLCSQKKDIDSSLEWLRICSKDSCMPSKIVYKANSLQVSAVIITDRAKFHDKTDDGNLKERNGYLVRGDRVMLLDFFQSYEDFYYRVEYLNDKITTTGWISASQLLVAPIK